MVYVFGCSRAGCQGVNNAKGRFVLSLFFFRLVDRIGLIGGSLGYGSVRAFSSIVRAGLSEETPESVTEKVEGLKIQEDQPAPGSFVLSFFLSSFS